MSSLTKQQLCQVTIALSLAVGAWGTVRPAHAQPPADSQAVSEEQRKAASQSYARGLRSFQARRFEEALGSFRESYAQVQSPNSNLMIGRALAELDRPVEAYDVLRTTIAEAQSAAKLDPRYVPTREAAERELAALEGRVGRLRITLAQARGDEAVYLNDERIELDGESKVVAPGPVTVRVMTPSGERAEAEGMAEAGTITAVELSVPKAPVAPVPAQPLAEPAPELAPTTVALKRTTAYVLGGVAVAGLAGFVVLDRMSQSKFDEVENNCSSNPCPARWRDTADRAWAQQTAANVSLVVGLFALGTGGLLYWSAEREESGYLRASVGVGPGSVSLKGQF